jgi:hypothetical protein
MADEYEDDLYLLHLKSIGASESVIAAALRARTATNFVPVPTEDPSSEELVGACASSTPVE